MDTKLEVEPTIKLPSGKLSVRRQKRRLINEAIIKKNTEFTDSVGDTEDDVKINESVKLDAKEIPVDTVKDKLRWCYPKTNQNSIVLTQCVLDAIDLKYKDVKSRFEEEGVQPKVMVINAAFRKMFKTVTIWGEKPPVMIETDRSNTFEHPGFYFEY